MLESLWNEIGLEKDETLRLLDEKLRNDLDFTDGHILGSMCSDPHPLAKEVYAKYLTKNIGDPGLVPDLVELEQETIAMLGKLLSNDNSAGVFTTGGTEANIVAMVTARKHSKKGCCEVVMPESAHFSFDKAADLMGTRNIKVPLKKNGKVDVDLFKKAITSETFAIIGVAGTTGLGIVDEISLLSEIAMEHDLYFHVDAAFGGFVIPFLEKAGYSGFSFDFANPGVSSITIDPHKMGRSAIPAGCLIYRNEEIARFANTKVTYLSGGETDHKTLVGTRSGAAVAATWATMKHLGVAGYTEVVKSTMGLSQWFSTEIEQSDGFHLFVKPELNVLGIVAEDIPAPVFARALRKKGWAVSLFDEYIRIVIMPHLSKDQLRVFLASMVETRDQLLKGKKEKRP